MKKSNPVVIIDKKYMQVIVYKNMKKAFEDTIYQMSHFSPGRFQIVSNKTKIRQFIDTKNGELISEEGIIKKLYFEFGFDVKIVYNATFIK